MLRLQLLCCCNPVRHTLFYKNGEFQSEPGIFLTSICYFSNLLPYPFGNCFKLHLRTKTLFSSSQIHSKTNILRDSEKIEANLSLGILIKFILIKKECELLYAIHVVLRVGIWDKEENDVPTQWKFLLRLTLFMSYLSSNTK